MPPKFSKQTPKAQKTDTTTDSEQHAIGVAEDVLATHATQVALASETFSTAAYQSIKDDFVPRFEQMLAEIKGVRSDIKLISTRVSQAEERISTNEDEIVAMKAANQGMKSEMEALTRKLDDLDNQNRRSNVRLLGLPEKAEGNDLCMFLTKWIPEVLGAENFGGPLPLLIESARRVGRLQDTAMHPRVVIMKFLNYADKVKAMAAARRKGTVYYDGKKVMFFQDFSTDLIKQRKTFDTVKRLLSSLSIPDLRFGIIHPAKMLVTYQGKRHIFNNASEASTFAKQLKEEEPDVNQ
ncbi:hypothetical protein WMY93_020889 [Mugilogobius chulae]|uniref:LINE-1 type transposase domain-containing protein 1 n=1 Tax=Mugilogobius chulae TaxID=88201 RepID=A0AAW0NJ60_9GOBI